MQFFETADLAKYCNDSLFTSKSMGVDGINIDWFKDHLESEFEIVQRKIADGSYNFSFYKEELILKGADSKPRQISIATIRDKLVLKGLQAVLKSEFADLLKNSDVQSKIRKVKGHLAEKKYDAFIKLDIKTFFPTIDHTILLEIIKLKISDEKILSLLEKAITQTTVSSDLPAKNRKHYANKIGIPQGLCISSLLAEIYVASIDKQHAHSDEYAYFRFADDILVLCLFDDCKKIGEGIKDDMLKIKLQTHDFKIQSEKSSYGQLKDGVQFLGYYFKGSLITVRPYSLDKIFRGINKVFLKYYKYSKAETEEEKIKQLYQKLNLKITGCVVDREQRGWLYFFSYINDQKLLFKLDAYVKKACKRFKAPYQAGEVKKFSRTYYELLNIEKSNYIPKFESTKNGKLKLIKKSDARSIEALMKLLVGFSSKDQKNVKLSDTKLLTKLPETKVVSDLNTDDEIENDTGLTFEDFVNINDDIDFY